MQAGFSILVDLATPDQIIKYIIDQVTEKGIIDHQIKFHHYVSFAASKAMHAHDWS